MESARWRPTQGGKITARYTLVSPHPDRGLGEAWIAETESATQCLIKLHPLPSIQNTSSEDLLAGVRDIEAPGVAAARDAGEWEGWLYLTYEPCRGRSLWSWLEGWRTTRSSPTAATTQTLVKHLCSVVQAAHARGYSHGRLNPRSVVITSLTAPQPLVVFDWSLGALLSPRDLAECENYLDPEQNDRSRGADAQHADLFAMGVILAELLTLRATPFTHNKETWGQWSRARPRRDFTSVGPPPDDVPVAVWKLVERVVRRDGEVMNATTLRRAVKEAWGSAHEATAGRLQEAPTPLAPSKPASPPRDERADHAPLRSAALPAEAIAERNGVERGLRSASAPSTPPARSQTPPAHASEVGLVGDTFVEEEGLRERFAESTPATATSPRQVYSMALTAGNDTLPIEYSASHFTESAPESRGPAPFEDGDPTFVEAPESPYSPSDAFAHSGRRFDTASFDDPSSAFNWEHPPTHETYSLPGGLPGWGSRDSEVQSATSVGTRRAPTAFGHGGAEAKVAPGPALPRFGVPRGVAPVVRPTPSARPVPEAPSRSPAPPGPRAPRRPWWIAAAVIGVGGLLGVAVAFLLKLL